MINTDEGWVQYGQMFEQQSVIVLIQNQNTMRNSDFEWEDKKPLQVCLHHNIK